MSTAVAASDAPVCVQELQRAWAAVQAGHFRDVPGHHGHVVGVRPDHRAGCSAAPTWTPSSTEQVVPVAGCVGSCGASTLAVAMATAATGRPRVIECSSATTSGLAAASTIELGQDPSGWVRGTRDRVLLERTGLVLGRVEQVPVPSTPTDAVDLTVLDVGWELGQIMAADSWLRDQLASATTVVLVTTATVPGFRRLEAALHLLPGRQVMVAVVGPRRNKWPRSVARGAGARTQALDGQGRLFEVPHNADLGVSGLAATALPPALLHAAADLLGALMSPEGSTRR